MKPALLLCPKIIEGWDYKMGCEVWKDVVVDREEKDKYKGLYKVSNLGRIWSIRTNKMLTGGISKGYRQVALSVSGDVRQYKVHRLVLLAFDYKNYFKGAQVNHCDEDPLNNKINNLEWCTAKYNCNYGNHRLNISISTTGLKRTKEQCERIRQSKLGVYEGKDNPAYGTHTNGKEVICLNNLKVYPSMRQAGIELNCDNSTIAKICKGKKKTIHGYRFMYYEDYIKQANTEITTGIKESVAS